MKRFHVHIAVQNLEESIRFYSAFFGMPPTVLKPDYAKWMIEDPRINFAISDRGVPPGIDHLGIQVDSTAELKGLREQAASAEISAVDQKDAACCYARSDKYWTNDPQSIAWETFHTVDSIPIYGDANRPESACCTPASSKPIEQGRSTGCC